MLIVKCRQKKELRESKTNCLGKFGGFVNSKILMRLKGFIQHKNVEHSFSHPLIISQSALMNLTSYQCYAKKLSNF